ncbi:cysteine desulfurase [Helicobacter pylori]|nr:cysteine desulfurase [Helicobacter pylori]KAA6510354.1 cysteine desulfurase [Helicobacter pylori]KAA6516036.1 cysteine desulfurase [Helicobacter pylori]
MLVFDRGGIRISQNVFKNSSYFKLKLRKYLVFNHNLDLDKKIYVKFLRRTLTCYNEFI